LKKSLKKLFSPSAFIFLANIFFSGVLWGIHDAYLFLYLGEKRKASSSLLGNLKHFDRSNKDKMAKVGPECKLKNDVLKYDGN
jgi:hypothetical protein